MMALVARGVYLRRIYLKHLLERDCLDTIAYAETDKLGNHTTYTGPIRLVGAVLL